MKTMQDYGVYNAERKLAQRSYFIIDKKGVVRFKRVKRALRANKKAKVRLRLSRKRLASVRGALRRGRKLKAKVRLTLKDKAGNRTVVRRTIKLRAARR